ncbi:hypothetical protein PAL_GLEAN10004381 [Pteropus alecto]|uniref:Uncharacterized protein n=1 Tax=Pteropus alecto TaxID=9402 RepID=L5L7X1_PTEAL|nr:hypothetical protein PAL_GLEAN10004381 [Pteropus alecto]
MGRKEILKVQIAIPCQRPRKPTPEGLRQEPRGQLELEACRPKNGGDTSNDREPPTAAPELSIQDPPNAGHTAGLSHFAIAKAGTKAKEAKEAA